MKTIAITIDEGMIARLDRLSKSVSGTANRSSLIREAVGEYLSRVERETEEERESEIFKRHRAKLARQTAALVKGQAKP